MGAICHKAQRKEDYAVDQSNQNEAETPSTPKTKSQRIMKRFSTYGIRENEGHAVTKNATYSACRVAEFAANVMGVSQDQDRFICCPHLLKDIFFAGIFDGHGQNGHMRAEAAAKGIPPFIVGEYDTLNEEHKDGDLAMTPEMFEDLIVKSFTNLQERFTVDYDTTVLQPAKELKEKIEKESNVDLGELEMPMDGGTTATTIAVVQDKLIVSWVGDSRAVLGKVDESGNIVAEALTTDHNISKAGPEEIQRVKDLGGEITEKHLGIAHREGMLQLTRSLGDVPFHKGGVVLHEPERNIMPLDSTFQFIITASDGLWDNFTGQQAVEFVHEQLLEACKQGPLTSTGLHNISKKLEENTIAKSKEARTKSDDISVIILVFDNFKGANGVK